MLSQPLRLRGLKLLMNSVPDLRNKVAALAAAWIEILIVKVDSINDNRRSPCGCVD